MHASLLAYLEFLLLWLIGYCCILRSGFMYSGQDILRIGTQLSVIRDVYLCMAASAGGSDWRH